MSFVHRTRVISPEDIWTYSTRELTQTKFPFWSATITQTQESVSVGAGATSYVDIQPPSGETWWIEIGAYMGGYQASQWIGYYDYDGTTRRVHILFAIDSGYTRRNPTLSLSRVLTNSRYASIRGTNHDTASRNLGYGYSGFKLSKPLWKPRRLNNSINLKPFKKPTDLKLPEIIEALDPYKAEILGLDVEKPDEYVLAVILEEDTPLAVDPKTNFPVERFSAYVKADVLADLIAKFKTGVLDPVKTGYKRYLDKWKVEGIRI